jgi:glyoxylase-like metal-dependent hydrolase (beta-lactamase superfamily II)
MKRHVMLVAVVILATLSVAHAQQPSGRDIEVYPIGPLVAISNPEYAFQEVYFLRARGVANSVGIGTTAGTVLIDTKSPGWGPSVLSALQQVTDMAVTTIINTHGHEDHAGAIAEIPQPVEILMHENTRKRVKETPGATVKTFGDRTSLTVGKTRFQLYYFGKAHTDGDVIVVLPDIKLAYVGDLYMENTVPVVDLASGGSALALPQTLARMATELTGVNLIMSGHEAGPIGGVRKWHTWKEFQEYAEFTRDFVAAATAASKKGRTVDQTVAELAPPEKYKGYRMDGAKALVEAIFTELKAAR